MTTITDVRVATRPTRSWSGIAGSLNREWDVDVCHRAPVGADGTPWAQLAPALDGCCTTEQVLGVIRSGPLQVHDQVLHALLRRLAAGDELAGRTVLQTMLGRLPRMIRTAIARGLEDPPAAAAEALWEAIATYPLHRTTKVAANLALEALAALDGPRDRNSELAAGDLLDAHVHHAQVAGRIPPASEPLEDAAYALTWAHQRGLLTEAEIRLLARVHLAAVRPPMTQVARELGCSHDAVRQRHSVAVAKLAAAVRQALTEDQAE
jgi:hypothetical protein